MLIRQENDIEPRPRTPKLLAGGPHPSLGPIPPHRVSEFFPRNESNTASQTVLLFILQYYQLVRASPEPFALLEDTGDILAGFDGIQHTPAKGFTR